jgi:hypothetical protein
MNFDHRHYVPCLRWKQGEYLAIAVLSHAAREYVTPLIEAPEIGFDFEKRSAAKTIDQHLSPFAKRVAEKWGRPCFVDLIHMPARELMADGKHPVQHVFDGLRAKHCTATPVTSIGRDRAYQKATKQVIATDHHGVCIRVTLKELAKADLNTSIDALLRLHGVAPDDSDLVIDLEAPNFEPVDGFAKLVLTLLNGLPFRDVWRTLTIIGTSFPSTMAEVRSSPAVLPRWEWVLFKRLAARLREQNLRIPTFGDYGICHTDVPDVDMRLVKPSASLRYTIEDAWFIVKGRNVRDHGYGQYRTHCKTVAVSPYFKGAGYSAGDAYIGDCLQGKATTGNLTTWRKVGTNHHLEAAVRDIANFFEP